MEITNYTLVMFLKIQVIDFEFFIFLATLSYASNVIESETSFSIYQFTS